MFEGFGIKIINANKTRDFKTGNITSLEIEQSIIRGSNVVIIDVFFTDE